MKNDPEKKQNPTENDQKAKKFRKFLSLTY